MSNLGNLCHFKGGGALAYRKGGSALIFKGNPVGEIVVRVPWGPQSYVCTAYDTYHELSFSVLAQFVSGSGSIEEQAGGQTEVVMKIKILEAPATIELGLVSSNPCADENEDAGLSCSVLVSQRGATPRMKTGISVPRSSNGVPTTTVSIDVGDDRRLVGVV